MEESGEEATNSAQVSGNETTADDFQSSAATLDQSALQVKYKNCMFDSQVTVKKNELQVICW